MSDRQTRRRRILGKRRVLDEIGKRRCACTGVLKLHGLKEHGADVSLIVVHHLVGEEHLHRLRQGALIPRLNNKVMHNLLAQRFSAPLRVACLAKEAARTGCIGSTRTERISYEFLGLSTFSVHSRLQFRGIIPQPGGAPPGRPGASCRGTGASGCGRLGLILLLPGCGLYLTSTSSGSSNTPFTLCARRATARSALRASDETGIRMSQLWYIRTSFHVYTMADRVGGG